MGPRPCDWGSLPQKEEQWWRGRELAAGSRARGSRGPQVPSQSQSRAEIAVRARPTLEEAEVGRRTGRCAPPRPVSRM